MCSPTIDTILTGRPSVVAPNRKSTTHTRFGASAVTRGSAMDTPRCCGGAVAAPADLTSLHNHWTFLWLTIQPSPQALW